jgi:hypothetical protein
MVHIRLTPDVHDALRAVAAERSISLQQLAEDALRDALGRATVPAEAGIGSAYADRRDPRLMQRLRGLLATTRSVDLAGVTLLDFLSEEGWAYGPLSSALGAGALPARIAIQDRDGLAARARLALTYGIAETDEQALKASPKYLQLEYAEKLLELLAPSAPVQRARASMPPTWRWLLLTDDAVLAEPHTPRIRDGEPVSSGLMPVFEFRGDSPAAERLREHFADLWQTAR